MWQNKRHLKLCQDAFIWVKTEILTKLGEYQNEKARKQQQERGQKQYEQQ